VLILAGIALLVRLWLPGFVRQQITANLTATATAHVGLADVDLNLLRGRLALQRLTLTLTGEEQPVIAVANLAMNLRLLSLFHGQIDIEEIRCSGLQVEAVQQTDGQLNLNRLFPPTLQEEPPPPEIDLPALTVSRVHLLDSKVTYSDLTRTPATALHLAAQDATANDIGLQARGLSAPVAVRLEGTLEGSPLHGETHVFWQRGYTTVEATLALQQLALAVLDPYLQNTIALQNLSGHLGAQLRYRYSSGGEQPPVHTLDGTVSLKQMRFADPAFGQTALELPNGQVMLETLDFLHGEIRLKAVELLNAKLFVLQTPTGLNWTSVAQMPNRAGQPPLHTSAAPAWRFSLPLVKLTGGEIVYRDSRWADAEAITLSPEEIQIEHLGSETNENPFRFHARLGEGALAGEGKLFSSPFALQMQLQPLDVDLASLRPLLVPLLAVKDLQGKVSGTVRTELVPYERVQTIKVSGSLDTVALTITGVPDLESVFAWETGHVDLHEGSTLSPFAVEFRAELAQVSAQGLTQGACAIEKVIGDLRLTTDKSPEVVRVNGTLATTVLRLSGTPEPQSLLAWETSHIEFGEGSTLVPFNLDLAVQLARLSVQHLQQGDISIEKANAKLLLSQDQHEKLSTAQGETTPELPSQSEAASPESLFSVHAQGDVELLSFALTFGPEKQILLGSYQTRAKLEKGSRLVPLDVRFRDVALKYAYAQGVRTASGQFQLVVPPAATASAEAQPPVPLSSISEQLPTEGQAQALPSSAASSFAVQIDRATVIGGELYFEDHAVTPPQIIYWQDVRADLNTVAYPFTPPATFAVRAFNMDGSPVQFQGTTRREGGQIFTRVHGQVERLSLPRFNAYLEPSLGYRVREGTVSLTWDLRLPGDRLQADMQVTLHDLGLGGKQDTSTLEQQVGLPLTLVIALLKDLNGNISLRLPVEGRMSEPGFRLSGAILKALRDVLIGAVISPLKLLGAVFKRKGNLRDFTLEPIRFVPGTSQLSEQGKDQLERLGIFLAERPELDLRVNGSTGSDDLRVLKDRQILTQLQARVAETATQPKPETEPAEEPSRPATPQDEVLQFLAQQLDQPKSAPVPTLSPQATELLAQLRQDVMLPAQAVEHLAGERVDIVIGELTTHRSVSAARFHRDREKQRGSGGAEVRYMIQTREEQDGKSSQ
jgi:hypothetical protein